MILIRIVRLGLLAALLIAMGPALRVVAHQEMDTSPLAELGYPELNIAVSDGTPELPAEIESGRYRVTATNETESFGSVTLVVLPEGMTLDEAMADETAFYTATIPGSLSLDPGTTTEAVIDVLPGELAVVVGFWEGDADPPPQIITVTGDAAAVESAQMPDAAVEATLIDFGFEMPETVAAGPGIWKVTNNGEQPHEMVVFQVPEGTTLEQIQAIAEADASGATPPADAPNPDEFVPAGGVATMSSGQTVWTALDLEPGTYMALCYVPDMETGMPHMMLGMLAVFTVE